MFRPRAILALALILLVCAVPMSARLGVRDSTHTMENIALLSSQETWQRQHAGEERAWLMPTANGQPRIQKPPLLVWLNLIAWADLDPATTDPSVLVFRGRVVSVALALVMVAAVFWMGLTLGDLSLAVIASLMAGTMIFLQRQGRTASYDVHMAAWAAMAVAAGLWAMRPFRDAPPPAVYWCGWLLAGFFMALSWLSKSPLGLLLVIGPLAGAIVLHRRRAKGNLIGLAIALVLCSLLVVPWYVYAFSHVKSAEALLKIEFEAIRDKLSQWYYYLNVFGLVVPWSIWLIAGVVHPFMRAAGNERRRRLIAWFWFVLLIVVYSLHPQAKQQRYILPIVPAAALLAATVWWDHIRQARAEQVDRGAMLLWLPHWCGLLAASLAFSLVLLFPQWLVDRGWADELPVSPQPPALAIPVGLVLTALAVLGWRWHARRRPDRAFVICAAWALIAATVFWYVYATTPTQMALVRADANRVAAMIGDAPLRYLLIDPVADPVPEEEFRFYISRIIPAVTPDELGELASSGRAFVLSTDDEPHRAALTAAGFEPLGEIREGTHATRHLWRSKLHQ